MEPTNNNKEFEALLNGNAPEAGNHGLVVSFGHHGILPAQARVRIYVGDQKGVKAGDQVYLYHYNSEAGKLEALPNSTNYKVDEDGYISIDLIHCSDYVILPKEAGGKDVISLADQT